MINPNVAQGLGIIQFAVVAVSLTLGLGKSTNMAKDLNGMAQVRYTSIRDE